MGARRLVTVFTVIIISPVVNLSCIALLCDIVDKLSTKKAALLEAWRLLEIN